MIPPGYSLRVAAPGPQPNAAHSAHAQPRYRGESTKTRGALRPSMIHTGHKKLQGRSFLPCNTPSLLIWRSVNPTKLVGLILIVGGSLALAFGGFSYTKDSSAVKIGPVELSVKQKETVNIPLWAGIGAIVAGGLLIAFGKK